MENKKDKRAHIRVPILSEAIKYDTIPVDGGKISTESCGLYDISNGGLFIKTVANIKPRSYINVYLQLPGDLGAIQVRGQVMWRRWAVKKAERESNLPLGMGVKFVDVTPDIKRVIEAYVIYIRNKQIITVSKRIIEEFFGPETTGF